MNYTAWRDSHVDEALQRFGRTMYGRCGAVVDRDVLEEAHRLATLRVYHLARGNANWKFVPIASLAKFLLDFVLDRVLAHFGLRGWRKFVVKIAIEILILVLVTALLAAPARETYAEAGGVDRALESFADEAEACAVL